MKIYTKEEALQHKDLIAAIKAGAVFVYPTDTIYGIGCDATNSTAVRRIRTLKQRYDKPFSVIAPSKVWITKNCIVPDSDVLDKLPGPYTLIVGVKHKEAICAEVNNHMSTLGVRIPAHWIAELVAAVDRPLVTTSVNISEKPYATTLEELKQFPVDFIIYEGPKTGRPSTIIDCFSREIKKR